jgi:glycosyltransferase involved in cell wall biosynthesis
MRSDAKKILLLGSQMETGGAQRLLLQQAEWFQSRGWEVIAAFLYDKENLLEQWRSASSFRLIDLRARQKGAGIHRQALLLIIAIYKLYRLMQVEKFDVILTFTHHSNLTGIPLAWWARIPVRAATHHGHILGFPKILEKLHAWLINTRLTSQFIVVSEPIRQEAMREGVRPAKITVIENGIQLPACEQIDTQRITQELKRSESDRLVLTVGRMTDQKAQIYLVKAIPAVLERFPDTVFAFAGDGPLFQDLSEEVQRLGIADQVRFLGVRKDVIDIMAAADVFVLSSIFEGLPVAMLEAMGMGAAVIATPVGGIPQVISHGETGLLVPVRDTAAITDALMALLSDEDTRRRFAKNGQDFVRREFTLEKMCLKYEELFFRSMK